MGMACKAPPVLRAEPSPIVPPGMPGAMTGIRKDRSAAMSAINGAGREVPGKNIAEIRVSSENELKSALCGENRRYHRK